MGNCHSSSEKKSNTRQSNREETERSNRLYTGNIQESNDRVSRIPPNVSRQQTHSTNLLDSASAYPPEQTQMVGQESNLTEVAGKENAHKRQVDGANTPQQRLELVRTELTNELEKEAYQYGSGSDCGYLADKTVKIAEKYGFKASLERETSAMLVEQGTIRGDNRQSNTAGEEMWFFGSHFWCKIEGIEYDPLFDKEGNPNMDLEDGIEEYRDCRIYKFKSGKAMVLEGNPITADTVFQSYQDAQAFVLENTPNYNSDAPLDSESEES
jgi:hypothetical protein